MEDDDSDDEANQAQTKEEAAEIQCNCDRTYGAYKELLKTIPGFQEKLKIAGGEVLTTYYSILTKGANDARSDDISILKRSIAVWLNKLPETKPHFLPDSCSNCGIQHNMAGKLLCPIEFEWDDL
ncbi:hypothetical protein C0991_010330, partial [Blastosporella zonata]